MLDVKDGVEALELWQGPGEYLLTDSVGSYDGWYDSRVWCENVVALEKAIREYRSNYQYVPCVFKVVSCQW